MAGMPIRESGLEYNEALHVVQHYQSPFGMTCESIPFVVPRTAECTHDLPDQLLPYKCTEIIPPRRMGSTQSVNHTPNLARSRDFSGYVVVSELTDTVLWASQFTP